MSQVDAVLGRMNPVPDGVAPPIERLWARLEAEGRAPTGPPRPERPTRRRGLASAALVAALVAVAIAVGAGAVVLLHSSHHSTGGPPASHQVLPSPSRGLVGILGVLRRPQTAADRDLGPALTMSLRRIRAGTPVMSLVRRVGLTPGGGNVVLVPVRPKGGRWPSRLAGGGTGLRLAVAAAGGVACCLTPGQIDRGGNWVSGAGLSGNSYVIIVPDGVARVSVALSGHVAARVHENVAELSVPRGVENIGTFPMTWFGPSGAVVKRFLSSLTPQQRAAAQRERLLRYDARAKMTISSAILRDFPLFGAGAVPGTFGAGAARFTITQPRLSALPTGDLEGGQGVDPMDVRDTRLVTLAGGLHFWLFAGRVICIDAPSQLGLCSLTGSLVATIPQRDPRLVIAVVPRATRTISLRTATGLRTVPVHDDVAVASARGVRSVTFMSGRARVTQPIERYLTSK